MNLSIYFGLIDILWMPDNWIDLHYPGGKSQLAKDIKIYFDSMTDNGRTEGCIFYSRLLNERVWMKE